MGYPRFMRRRGFGVHSPFAFRLITEVIGERHPFYDYKRLPGENDKLLYRFAAWLQPSEIKEYGKASAAVAKIACPHREQPRKPTSWAQVDSARLAVAQELGIEETKNLLSEKWVVWLHCDKEMMKQLRAAQLEAMTFLLHREGVAILFPFEHLPRQVIEI